MKFMAAPTSGLRTLAPLLLLSLFLLSAFSPSLAHAQPSTITVGTEPSGIAYDSVKGELFVANYNSGSVSVISDSTNTVVANVSVRSPLGVTYDSAKGEVWVVNEFGSAVSVISDSTDTATASVPVGSEPFGITYDSGKGEIFVSDYGTNSVSVISDSTNAIVATVKGLNGPQDLSLRFRQGRGLRRHPWSRNIADQHGLRDIRLHQHRYDQHNRGQYALRRRLRSGQRRGLREQLGFEHRLRASLTPATRSSRP